MTNCIRRQVIGSVATFPDRFDKLAEMVASIASQLDHLFIYVNGTTDGLPDLSKHSNLTVLDGRDHAGDISARGKVYPLRYAQDCEVFTLDDDFAYPGDYVARNLDLLRRFGGACLTTTHASIFPARVDWYYERTTVMASTEALPSLQLCSLAGSGTLCFDQRTLTLDLDDLLAETMVDLQISLAARAAGLPIWVLPRPKDWIHSFGVDGLWHELKDAGMTPHTALARQHDWDFDIYAELARNALVRAGLTPQDIGMGADLAQSLGSGTAPNMWRHGGLSLRKWSEYLDTVLGELGKRQA